MEKKGEKDTYTCIYNYVYVHVCMYMYLHSSRDTH